MSSDHSIQGSGPTVNIFNKENKEFKASNLKKSNILGRIWNKSDSPNKSSLAKIQSNIPVKQNVNLGSTSPTLAKTVSLNKETENTALVKIGNFICGVKKSQPGKLKQIIGENKIINTNKITLENAKNKLTSLHETVKVINEMKSTEEAFYNDIKTFIDKLEKIEKNFTSGTELDKNPKTTIEEFNKSNGTNFNLSHISQFKEECRNILEASNNMREFLKKIDIEPSDVDPSKFNISEENIGEVKKHIEKHEHNINNFLQSLKDPIKNYSPVFFKYNFLFEQNNSLFKACDQIIVARQLNETKFEESISSFAIKPVQRPLKYGLFFNDKFQEKTSEKFKNNVHIIQLITKKRAEESNQCIQTYQDEIKPKITEMNLLIDKLKKNNSKQTWNGIVEHYKSAKLDVSKNGNLTPIMDEVMTKLDETMAKAYIFNLNLFCKFAKNKKNSQGFELSNIENQINFCEKIQSQLSNQDKQVLESAKVQVNRLLGRQNTSPYEQKQDDQDQRAHPAPEKPPRPVAPKVSTQVDVDEKVSEKPPRPAAPKVSTQTDTDVTPENPEQI